VFSFYIVLFSGVLLILTKKEIILSVGHKWIMFHSVVFT